MGRKNAFKKHLNGVFRSILLIYGGNTKRYQSNFLQDNLRDTVIVNLKEDRFLQQVQKIELINRD